MTQNRGRTPARSHTDLIVWQKADIVTKAVLDVTRRFPAAQRYLLVAQMQRAASSIGANIAEGFSRHRPKDKAHFYTIALGSADELQHFWGLAQHLGLMAGMEKHRSMLKEVARMLHKLAAMTRAQSRD